MSILFSLAIAAAQAQGPVLTPDEAVAIAMNNAFSVRTAASVVEQTKQQVANAASNVYPHVSLGANYTRYDKEIAEQGITVIPLNDRTTSATVTMPIDIMGNLTRAIRAARAAVGASVENLEATKNTLRRDVRHAYYLVASSKELVQVDTAALKDQQDRLTNIQ